MRTADSGKTLTLNDGDFEVRMLAARTSKLVETRTFKGTSPDGCPYAHDFYGQNDDIITRVEPGLGRCLAGVEHKAPVAAVSLRARR